MNSPLRPRHIPEEALRDTEAIEAELKRAGMTGDDVRRNEQARAPADRSGDQRSPGERLRSVGDLLRSPEQRRAEQLRAPVERPAEPLPAPSDRQGKEREKEKDRDREKKKKKGKKREEEKQSLGSNRGIETMFRTTFQSHNDLVALADQKANMMISVNGIIISILLASLSPRLDETGWVLIPTGILLIGCIGSLVCGVLAARPRVTRNPATLDDVKASRANLLFFANFLGMPVTDYLEGMRWMMTRPDEVYLTMLRNLYALGHILEKKFRLLWFSYTIFLGGLGLAVIVAVFVLVHWLMTSPVMVPQQVVP